MSVEGANVVNQAAEIAIVAMGWTDPRMIADARADAAGVQRVWFLTADQLRCFRLVYKGAAAAIRSIDTRGE